jgi:hypothetical protein
MWTFFIIINSNDYSANGHNYVLQWIWVGGLERKQWNESSMYVCWKYIQLVVDMSLTMDVVLIHRCYGKVHSSYTLVWAKTMCPSVSIPGFVLHLQRCYSYLSSPTCRDKTVPLLSRWNVTSGWLACLFMAKPGCMGSAMENPEL